MAKYALLIGVSSYQNPNMLEPSLTARNDVKAVREILLHPEIGGFEHAISLLDPDRIQMEEAIEEFFRKLGREDLGVLLFAGQGLRDRQGRAYFTTQSTRKNSDGDLIKATAVPARVVQDIMGSSAARQQVMILDCGFQDLDPAAVAVFNGSLNLRGQLGGQGRVILLGSEAARPISHFDGGDELSPYTHLLVEGITTGKADRNHDQFVSVDELHDYVLEQLQPLLSQGYPELIVTREEDRAINLARVRHFDPRQEYRRQVESRLENGQFSPVGRAILDKRRVTLGLSSTEAQAIENEVLRPYREHAKDLQRYQQALTAALRLEYPLGPRQQAELKEFQALLELSDAEVEPIQQVVMRPFAEQAEMRQQNRAAYEQAFRAAIALTYPLSTPERLKLRQQQRSLDLSDAEAQAIEAQVLAVDEEQRQRYRRALQQFEQEWRQELEQTYPPTEAIALRMQKRQHSLGIQPEHGEMVAQRVQQAVEEERANHQARLDQYEALFTELTTQEATLRKPQRDRLAQMQQELNLSDAEIATVEDQATPKIQAQRQQHQQNLTYYQQECARLLQEEYPLSEAKQQDLKRLQAELHLSDAEAAQILNHLQAQAEAQHRAYAQHLERYEQDYRTAIALEHPPSDASCDRLRQTWQELGLKEADVWRLEQKIEAELTDIQQQIEADRAATQQLYEDSLLIYDRAYNQAAQHQYPLPDEEHTRLRELGHSLQLSEEDIQQIEDNLNRMFENAASNPVPAPPNSGVDADSGPVPVPFDPMDPGSDPVPVPLDPMDPGSDPVPVPPNPSFDAGSDPVPDIDFADFADPTPPPPHPTAGSDGEFGPIPVPPPPDPSPVTTPALSSERNIDYSVLQELLREGMWREADRETFRVMLLATDRNREDWLSPDSLQRFPCTDLATISQLWDQYSQGHFGFLAQERVYQDIFLDGQGNKGERQRIVELGVRLRWIWKAGRFYPLFRNYRDLDFAEAANAVTGHLPALWFWKLSPVAALRVGTVGGDRSFGGADIHMFSTLMKRLRECNIG